MSNHPQHRGAHPEDARLFGPHALAKLRLACQEAAWLRGRDYPIDVAVRIVGEHHQLTARQRIAVRRAVCSEAERSLRQSKTISFLHAGEKPWEIDGFNLMITLEVALSGGVLLRGGDGTVRDIAGLRGSYRPVQESESALALLGSSLAAHRVPSARLWLDAPVSNSGRLRALIVERAAAWPCPVSVELVKNVDEVLAAESYVVSSDSVVIERCASWLNLAAWIIAEYMPKAWILDLCVEAT